MLRCRSINQSLRLNRIGIRRMTEKRVDVGRWRPMVIAGPSGVGKGTLISRLRKDYPNLFGKCITHTTRAPRGQEQHGVAYYFVTREQFEEEWKAGNLVERATIHGNFYGTSIKAIQDVAKEEKICVLDIDVQGCESVKKAGLNPFCVFLVPPSFDELKKRLQNRGEETPEQIEVRLRTAQKEMEWKDRPNFWDKILVNDNLEECYKELKNCISEAYNVEL